MTTEEDFQQALDRESDNHLLRRIFGDWLGDHGNPRAAGYRALGLHERVPRHFYGNSEYLKYNYWGWCYWGQEQSMQECRRRGTRSCITKDWFSLCKKEYQTRREAEDAAALAFVRLPPERQAELLSQPVLC